MENQVNTKDVLVLREMTILPILTCKKALVDSKGNFDQAFRTLIKENQSRWGDYV